MTIDEFAKCELRAVTIKEASRIPNSQKLLKLILQDGESPRQIVSGIGGAYEPEDLIGKQVVIIANLESKVLMGEESNGMLLAAHGEAGEPILLIPQKPVPAGSKIS